MFATWRIKPTDCNRWDSSNHHSITQSLSPHHRTDDDYTPHAHNS